MNCNGFNFELYNTVYTNCFIFSSRYVNGDLQLSLFGRDPETNQIGHFADITLYQTGQKLESNEIVVDDKFKPELIPQLLRLGILGEQTGLCIIKNKIYAIYSVDFTKIKENSYYIEETIAA